MEARQWGWSSPTGKEKVVIHWHCQVADGLPEQGTDMLGARGRKRQSINVVAPLSDQWIRVFSPRPLCSLYLDQVKQLLPADEVVARPTGAVLCRGKGIG